MHRNHRPPRSLNIEVNVVASYQRGAAGTRCCFQNGGASLVELLQKPLLRLQFYRRYLVLANSRTLAAGKAASKEATASVVVRAFQTVDKLCRKLSEASATMSRVSVPRSRS